MMNLKSTISD